jgi:hypothetical protein
LAQRGISATIWPIIHHVGSLDITQDDRGGKTTRSRVFMLRYVLRPVRASLDPRRVNLVWRQSSLAGGVR